ncbi:MAG: hypothetical protein OXJ64_10985 [Boseongicola sp.]|nr:hypothetical protein [Boseongicola sp.]
MGRLLNDDTPTVIDFEALERAGRDAALGVMGRLVAARLNADRGSCSGSAINSSTSATDAGTRITRQRGTMVRWSTPNSAFDLTSLSDL